MFFRDIDQARPGSMVWSPFVRAANYGSPGVENNLMLTCRQGEVPSDLRSTSKPE